MNEGYIDHKQDRTKEEDVVAKLLLIYMITILTKILIRKTKKDLNAMKTSRSPVKSISFYQVP